MSTRLSMKQLTLFASLALTAAQFSCRPASYEVVKLGQNKKTDTGVPSNVVPPNNTTNPPVEIPASENLPPTARVEVIWQGNSVTVVTVNQPTTIRPTTDTLDVDDVGKSACVNPGIVRADYIVGSEAKPSASRASGCEQLSVPYTFTKTGQYEIVMTVTTNENEKAEARMTLTVVDGTQTADSDGGFTIGADPMVGGKGQVITFVGRCELKHNPVITWNFGDGTTANGSTVTHVYDTIGQHRVLAKCTDDQGKTINAEVTIVTLDKTPTTPIGPKNPLPIPVNPPVTSGNPGQNGDGSDPGQNPGNGYDPGVVPTTGYDPGTPETTTTYDPQTGEYYVPY